jgi:hypothetical protein
LPGGFVEPQVGQAVASDAPQSPQNRLSLGFSVPQLAQITHRSQLAFGSRAYRTQRRFEPAIREPIWECQAATRPSLPPASTR